MNWIKTVKALAVLSVFGGFFFPALAQSETPSLDFIRERTYFFIRQNLQHSQIRPGAVIASPAQYEPNYFHHWTRDAGLTMHTVISHEFRASQMPSFAPWAEFEFAAQNTAHEYGVGLGEPIFEVDGSLYSQPWGRPQNDGPAIRALTMIQGFANLEQLGQNPGADLRQAIAADLEYTANHINSQGFDLWEEVRGLHFFTGLLQWKALKRGTAWARQQGLDSLAQLLESRQGPLLTQLENHLEPTQNRWQVTVQQTAGWGHKISGLDVSVLLAYLYFQEEAPFHLEDPRLANTVRMLEERFAEIYPISAAFPTLPPAIGRYPEDVYDGHGFSGGNPWFLATAAVGEYHCRLARKHLPSHRRDFDAREFSVASFVNRLSPFAVQPVTTSLLRANHELARGRAFVQRVFLHAGEDMNMSEQFNRSTGFRQGAHSLTWSFSALYRAAAACDLNYELSSLSK